MSHIFPFIEIIEDNSVENCFILLFNSCLVGFNVIKQFFATIILGWI